MLLVNRLAKWKHILVGWQLGTRAKTDPESQALADHREATLIMRAELNALTTLLIEQKFITASEMAEQTEKEAGYLMKQFEIMFPGAKATDSGMELDLERAQSWLEKFPK